MWCVVCNVCVWCVVWVEFVVCGVCVWCGVCVFLFLATAVLLTKREPTIKEWWGLSGGPLASPL